MKKLIRMIFIGTTAIGGVFANDCNAVLGSVKNLGSIDAIYNNVLPPIAFKQALINLKAYCCMHSDLGGCATTGEKENLPKEYFPESEFLFDHLLDIAMRRLDGITGLAYNMAGDPKGVTPDPTGLERRTKITEIAKSASGAQGSSIESLYTGYWEIKKPSHDILLQQYNNKNMVSLGDKYDTICGLITEIYGKVGYENTGTSEKTLISDNFLNDCKILVRERVNKEIGYVKILMVQKSNQLFDEGMKAYTQKHFVQEKLMALWNLIVKVKDLFQTVIQQAPASKTCSL